MASVAQSFITRWDLDKTYLRSRFDTLSDLVSSALEKVEQKRTVPGATEVLRELGRSGGRVHILSGSPRQFRGRLSQKLRIDGVSWDELTLKPNLSNLLRMRLYALRDQLGYKLPELLEARARDEERFGSGLRMREVLVGDDSESDAFVYSLYADLSLGEVPQRELENVLAAGNIGERTIARCKKALARLRHDGAIECILIHLDGQTPPSLFSRYGARLVPFYNYLQAAFVLLDRGFLSEHSTLEIASAFQRSYGFTADTAARSYLDLVRRGHLGEGARVRLTHAVSELAAPSREERALVESLGKLSIDGAPLSVPRRQRPDYLELAAFHGGGRNRRRPGQRFG
ncbi:MAG TPA: hypothetical protein VFQ35_19965 [Polyangiaceae bacterium]|nr:hypothetical protein [Polyangiaceae bacterium]